MSQKLKFLPVLALAVVLAPFAASARSDRGPVQDPAHLEVVAGSPAGSADAGQGANGQVASAHGRAAQSNPPGGEFLMEISPQYAAVATQPDEN